MINLRGRNEPEQEPEKPKLIEPKIVNPASEIMAPGLGVSGYLSSVNFPLSYSNFSGTFSLPKNYWGS